MECVRCGQPERQFVLQRRDWVLSKHPKNQKYRKITGLMCSDCVQSLMASGREIDWNKKMIRRTK